MLQRNAAQSPGAAQTRTRPCRRRSSLPLLIQPVVFGHGFCKSNGTRRRSPRAGPPCKHKLEMWGVLNEHATLQGPSGQRAHPGDRYRGRTCCRLCSAGHGGADRNRQLDRQLGHHAVLRRIVARRGPGLPAHRQRQRWLRAQCQHRRRQPEFRDGQRLQRRQGHVRNRAASSATPGGCSLAAPPSTTGTPATPSAPRSPTPATGSSPGAKMLDYFVFVPFNLGNAPAEFRVGNQVISWGESTFIQGGINLTNPFDVSKLRVPGASSRKRSCRRAWRTSTSRRPPTSASRPTTSTTGGP
jgi:hypothetical protein